MRWYTLDVPFDRDGYDEGVYWQSLRALAEGHTLYGQIFSSQPPAFLFSILPTYLLFGQSLFAARLGVALLSLCGLLGALFVGKVLRGKAGALLALLLLVISPLYLAESQTLQADAPSTALMLLTLGLAYLWWEHPVGLAGYILAVLTTIILILSILCKLFALTDLVPIGLLVLAHLWRIRQQPAGRRLAYGGSLLAGACALVLTGLLLLIPFSASFSQLWDQVVTFHTVAKAQSTSTTRDNLHALWQALQTPLALFALYGTLVSLARRDWRVLPLIAWLLTILYLLWQQMPLFPHHLVILAPPLVLLAMMSLLPYPQTERKKREEPGLSPETDSFNGMMPATSYSHRTDTSRPGLVSARLHPYGSAGFALGNGITIIALCIIIVYVLPIIRHNYQWALQQTSSIDTKRSSQVAHDLAAVTRSDQLVITDAQFLVASADRSVPPQLVDTSFVRIQSGYLSNAQLMQISQHSGGHTVLFYTGRLYQMREFYLWVSQHFQKVRDYGNGRELWIKME